ncbi:TrmH family RNA methyltransferase [Paenibacillus sp. Leaf72]|uniref:TrmH family RNA methyltransferase n=1 Tax=Paenibacillus sp. Leaf72 TaxID=1736234 RepID=UPI0006F68F92|nr:RNA methyltransferase [Paenibacillus sp. Leaf72]KQN98893.1 rRNA methyltransferase [Paenibacillus sp. Leaf72]
MNNHSLLTSIQNDRVKQWASLLDKKYRDRLGKFIIEGVHLVQEAFAAGAAIEAVMYDAERGLPEELRKMAEQGGRGSGYAGSAAESAGIGASVEWIQAARPVMAKCSGTDTPPPVFAVVRKLEAADDALFSANGLVVVLDGVRDPGNVGTIIRSADAVGANGVVLGKGCADLYNPKTVRSTMGSLFHLPIIEADLTELLPAAQDRGFALVGTSLEASHTCYSYDWTAPTWLLLGNESEGLSASSLEAADETVIIPMHGRAESLNVAMAATVLLHEAMRQRRYA